MSKEPNVPGKYKQVYTVDTHDFLDFERLKEALLTLPEIEDVLYNDEVSPPEVTLLTDGNVTDPQVQQVAAQLGYNLQPRSFLIS